MNLLRKYIRALLTEASEYDDQFEQASSEVDKIIELLIADRGEQVASLMQALPGELSPENVAAAIRKKFRTELDDPAGSLEQYNALGYGLGNFLGEPDAGRDEPWSLDPWGMEEERLAAEIRISLEKGFYVGGIEGMLRRRDHRLAPGFAQDRLGDRR